MFIFLVLGGMYRLVTLVIGQTTSFVALYLFAHARTTINGSAAAVSGDGFVGSSLLLPVIASLSVSSVLLFAALMATVNPGFSHTFFTTMTGKQFYQQCYHEATSDQAKISILKRHSSYYEPIRDDIKNWISMNWSRWSEEKPEWLTARLISCIPEDMIPKGDEGSEKINQEKHTSS